MPVDSSKRISYIYTYIYSFKYDNSHWMFLSLMFLFEYWNVLYSNRNMFYIRNIFSIHKHFVLEMRIMSVSVFIIISNIPLLYSLLYQMLVIIIWSSWIIQKLQTRNSITSEFGKFTPVQLWTMNKKLLTKLESAQCSYIFSLFEG